MFYIRPGLDQRVQVKRELVSTPKQQPMFPEDLEEMQFTVLFHSPLHKSGPTELKQRKIFLQSSWIG